MHTYIQCLYIYTQNFENHHFPGRLHCMKYFEHFISGVVTIIPSVISVKLGSNLGHWSHVCHDFENSQ